MFSLKCTNLTREIVRDSLPHGAVYELALIRITRAEKALPLPFPPRKFVFLRRPKRAINALRFCIAHRFHLAISVAL